MPFASAISRSSPASTSSPRATSRRSTPSPTCRAFATRNSAALSPGHADSVYLTGRNIGDEYRYVLDRRGQRKYPGQHARTAELPAEPVGRPHDRDRRADRHQAATTFAAAGSSTHPPSRSRPVRRPSRRRHAQPGAADFANLDFLAEASAVALNLTSRTRTASIKLTAQGPRAARDDPRRRGRSARHDLSHA